MDAFDARKLPRIELPHGRASDGRIPAVAIDPTAAPTRVVSFHG
ncbi:hypothetical protein OOZ54_06585 [Rhodopseudomonas palustris]|nr:hypothetical protein [Rhodopseudomonas palustris]WBU31156.1 hypothetical protein OOZ54_06585 [Rhodopseudomonas palustris]